MGSTQVRDARGGRRPGLRRLPPQERALHNIQKSMDRRSEYAADSHRKALQNASKAKSRKRHAESNAGRTKFPVGDCELEADSEGVVEDHMVDREERRVALSIAEFISSELATCPGPNSRKAVLGRVLDHKKVCRDLPDHILSSKVVAAYEQVVGGVSAHLDLVKRGNSAAKLATKHAILDATVTSLTGQSSARQVARVLGVHHRNVLAAITRRSVINNSGEFICMLVVRKKRGDGLSSGERRTIIEWWVVESRVSPNKKDVTRKWLSPGVYDTKPTHYLQETQTQFFIRFAAAFPDVSVAERAFGILRPFYVKRISERNTCCCIYHVELQELLIALNNMRAGLAHTLGCNHSPNEKCEASCIQYAGITELWQSILCPKGEFEEWHNVNCLYGQCPNCGVHMLPLCPDESEGSDGKVMEWRRFALEETMSKKGKVLKKLNLVYKKTTTDVFLEYLKPKLQAFVTHNFVARWEDQQFKVACKSFPKDTVVSIVDYAENYKFKIQNEVQSMHWHSYQVSIFVQITYRHNPAPDLSDPESFILTEYHFYISDDKHHDSEFIQYCFGVHWDYMSRSGFQPKQHWVWSDGCANQFKSSRPWYFVSRYPNMTNGCSMLWSFFGSGHGKGPHDGAGAVVKSFIRREQLKPHGQKLQCANDVVVFLQARLGERVESTYSGRRKPMKRYFWEILEENVQPLRDSSHKCDVVHGTRKIHSIMATNKNQLTQIMVKPLACFCVFCIDNQWSSCVNGHWTGQWEAKYLQPADTEFVRTAMLDRWDGVWQWGDDGQLMASTLEIGDNFAVNAAAGNSEGQPFWLIRVSRPLHRAKADFTCKWGTEFEKGDMVVGGHYYQKWGHGESSYVLLRHSHVVYLHAAHIRAVKFLMPPKNHRVTGNDLVYELEEAIRIEIMTVIAAVDDEDDDELQ